MPDEIDVLNDFKSSELLKGVDEADEVPEEDYCGEDEECQE